MTQLQTLQDIYSKISDIYEKFCDFDERLIRVETKVTNTYDKLITIQSDVDTIKALVSVNITGSFDFTLCKDEPANEPPYPAIVDILISALISNLTNLIINAAFGSLKVNALINLVISKTSDLISNGLLEYIKSLLRQTLKPSPKITTLPYTGQGLNGIANQVSAIALHLDKMTQLLCPDLTIPVSSLDCVQDETGRFSLIPSARVITGRGLNVLPALGNELSNQQGKIIKAVCAISASSSDAVPLFVGERFEKIPVSTQLVLRFLWKDAKTPKEKNSAWYMSIPDPIPCEKLNWCIHFDKMERIAGNVFATVNFGSHTNKTSCYFQNEDDAIDFMTKWVIPLSKTEPVNGNDGSPVRIVKNGTPTRKPRNRLLKCVSATWVEIDKDTGEPKNTWTFKPPAKGC